MKGNPNWNSMRSPGQSPQAVDPGLCLERAALRDRLITDRRHILVRAVPETTYQVFTGLGGERGWLWMNWAWRLRAALDRMAGGVGMRPRRSVTGKLQVGDTVDFWRVEALESGRLLRLRAEMKLPGRGWLEFRAEPQPDQSSRLTQTAFFQPDGVTGLLYWFLFYPAHHVLFFGLIRRIARAAENGNFGKQ